MRRQQEQCNWVQEDGIKILEIMFYNDFHHMQNDNWRRQINKLKISLNLWKNRKLSLKGRATFINNIALSKLWYLADIVIPKNNKVYDAIEKIIFDFLWQSKTSLIKRETCYLPLNEGGLGILNPEWQTKALLLKAFCQISNPDCEELWVCFPRYWIGNKIKVKGERFVRV